MKLTTYQATKLTEMCFAEKTNKEIAEELGRHKADVWILREGK